MTDKELEQRFQTWQSTASAPEALVECAIAGLPTRSQKRRTLPLFLTTAAVAVGIAGYFYNEQQQGRWHVEQVVHALEKAQEVRWIERHGTANLPDMDLIEENFITANPPRHIMRMLPTKKQQNQAQIIYQSDSNGSVQYWSHHYVKNSKGQFLTDTQGQLISDNQPLWIVAPSATEITSRYLKKPRKTDPTLLIRSILDSIISPLSRNGNWKRREINQAGKSYLELTQEGSDPRYRIVTTLWVDPSNHWLVRETRDQFDQKEKTHLRSLKEDFHYNEPPPAEVVLTQPPKGARIVSQRQHLSVWNRLSKGEQAEIKQQIVRAEQAWREANFEALAGVMAFDFPADGRNAERRRNWERRVLAQKGRWERWESKVVSASADGKFLGVGVHIDVKGTIDNQPVASDWEEGLFRFRREKDGLKLVGWDYPKDSVIQMHSKMIAQYGGKSRRKP